MANVRADSARYDGYGASPEEWQAARLSERLEARGERASDVRPIARKIPLARSAGNVTPLRERGNALRIYVINLARRPDRMAAMQVMTDSLGLELTRIDAVDARTATQAELDRYFMPSGPVGEIAAGDRCCGLSHRLFWQRLVDSGDAYAAVLEDDAVLTRSAVRFLKDTRWIPQGVDMVKLEHFGPASQKIVVSDFQTVAPGFQVARLCSRHTGTGGYIISRRAALKLLAMEKFDLPVDHLLFNPNNSPLFAALAPRQLIPAVLRQQDFIGAKSDIETWRMRHRKFNWTYVKRELVRFGYELRLLPRQAAAALTGRAKLIQIATEQAAGDAR
jgi:glycosyl transferase, family 25